ncbi:hypothetical protein ACFV9D_33655 [Streptomyces sp. NPDC059875]|uniref:hypothetical protein n=1 Tax=unclassified Streptomyces TaxID=2593676 RepID=UPI00364EECC7
MAVGHGLVPRVDLGRALGCATRATPDGATALVVDSAQRTTVAGLRSAGETAGAGGARLALTEAELAGTAIAVRLRGASAEGSSARTRSLLRTRPGCGPSPR